jgi:hypothetical protein
VNSIRDSRDLIKRQISVSVGDPFNSAAHGTGWTTREVITAKQFKDIILKNTWSAIVWREGKRKQDNFVGSSYAVLDLDDGITIEDARAKLDSQKLSYIIAPSRNHRKEKNGITADRFRIVMKFEKPILNLEDYRYNMRLLIREWEADPACKDGARFFFPSQHIYSFGIGSPLPVKQEPPKEKTICHHPVDEIPNWAEKFLRFGEICGRGRNNSIYACSLVLKELGFSKEDTFLKISGSPFPRNDFGENEIRSAINSAFKK